MGKVNKNQVRSWILYDWANSSFATTVMAGFFPLYFKEYLSVGVSTIVSTSRLGQVTSLSGLTVALMVPLLGALSDRRRLKKFFLFIMTALGVLGSGALAFVDKGDWLTACWFYALAFIGFSAASTFYDALLPNLAPPEDLDRISSQGFALGYLGGGLLFLLNVVMYLKPEFFGITSGLSAVQLSFLSVSAWWMIFSIPLFAFVAEPEAPPSQSTWLRDLAQGLLDLRKTVSAILKNRALTYFLIAFWLYIDGVYTIISMAVDFGLSIGLSSKDLIAALLLVQFVGFPGGLLAGKLAAKFRAQKLILICVLAYMGITVLATLMTQSWHFYLLASLIGLFQGGIQSLSRSLFARLIPVEKSGEYFGFVNLVGKFASILGPLLIAVTTTLSGSHRLALLSLSFLFLGGIYFLRKMESIGAA
jgi:MFS transporter, UMF1 family